MLRSLSDTLRFLLCHPLSKGRRLAVLRSFVGWQFGSRLVPGPVAVPFVGNSMLLATPGMTAATGNVYVGLQDFEDMAFVVHALRPGDVFADVGANVGAYTLLAAAGSKSDVVAFEPGDDARRWLGRNVLLNRLGARVEIREEAVGAASGQAEFSVDLGTTNAVVAEAKAGSGMRTVHVPVVTLDEVLGGRCPAVIKIDVEGFETEVIAGARQLLRDGRLLAILLELNGSGTKYGHDERKLVAILEAEGFASCRYDPFLRQLTRVSLDSRHAHSDNVIFARGIEGELSERLTSAPKFEVRGRAI